MKWYEDTKRTQQIARTLCRSTHENTSQLLSDAEVLIEKKSFGHGYALAVLAFEEWSKWWMGVGMYMGLLQYDDDFARNMKNHIEKQFYAIQIIFQIIFSEWFEVSQVKNDFLKISKQFWKGKISEKRHNKLLIDLLDQDSIPEAITMLDMIKQMQEFEVDPRKMETKKQRGLYVELDSKKEGVFTPLQFSKNDVEPFVKYMKELILYTKELNEALLGRRKYEKEFQKNIVNIGRNLRNLFDYISKN